MTIDDLAESARKNVDETVLAKTLVPEILRVMPGDP